MHPSIRKVVSDLTYNGELRDGFSLTSRPNFSEYLSNTLGGFRIGVLNHSYKEEKVSFFI